MKHLIARRAVAERSLVTIRQDTAGAGAPEARRRRCASRLSRPSATGCRSWLAQNGSRLPAETLGAVAVSQAQLPDQWCTA
ncbi:hypothetical protein SANT12839_045590 [Streptomyces antimycoticus]|uniref:Uncharacterized protein n=1 Tax=Streptomyces antimycoticus TaxID=68175 RepID=A0A4D4KBG9_9ACTN|nr:hypothetical protein [Streptomyces antimycoticus]GDY43677.1 hypothetical protein SANT12839_045590 [Streptomyces antimycoticus]